ncbi:PadR family transcriptional regulator [Sphingomonas sp. NSE70-1]|uniref:PadR family transcriptional regulator n=1 Tax=Sphingomonas caseinilyticus TaxID=2908205 RepID=A0ABT0RTR8_9SPHN|nr:PadR family transcriptional regulator [Sphingomonas caseinilyticus]MCL6698316.1 PadR family transcriptional regulator [Sphingomonas caseinilyticus]
MHFHYECDDNGNHRRHAGRQRRSFSLGPFDFDVDFGINEGKGRGGWGGGRRGRDRKRMFEGGQLRLVLLKLIADEPRHGYELIKAVEELTGGEYAPSPGIVYPTLTMLEDMGLITEAKSKSTKKIYEATDEGRAHLEENSDEVDELIERLEGHGHHRRRGQRPEIGRAMGNLMAALRNRIVHDGWNDELLEEVIDILDEAAQRIERVKDAKGKDED